MVKKRIKDRFINRYYPLLSLFLSLHILTIALIIGLSTGKAAAQQGGVPIIRDAEIEALVKDYALPILRVAKQRTDIRVIIVNDNNFNAFVDGYRIFINSGTLETAKTPNEVIGVLAHEVGHLAGGHQYRLRERLKQAQTFAVVGLLLGIGAGIAGEGSAGSGIMAGSQEFALRNLLNYRRSEETIADRSAIKYLTKTGQSGKGMLATFERFSTVIARSGAKIDPYRQSHPLPRARISSLKDLAKKSPYYNKEDSKDLQLRHDMVRAKIAAYKRNLSQLQDLFAQNPDGLPARYAQAITAVEHQIPTTAIAKVQKLIKSEPKNPYFRELLGEAYMQANQPKNAANAYKAAIKLDRQKSAQLYIGYARTLLAIGTTASINKAINVLKIALRKENDAPSAYNYLALAYGRSGKIALADLATADMYYYNESFNRARYFASRAQEKLKKGSYDWLRAQDILNATRQPQL